MEKEFDLNFHIHRLLMKEPFFAVISRTVEKISSKAIPTAGVRLNPDTTYFEMLYNPDFFAKLTDEEASAVIMHEYFHLILSHVTERLPEGKMTKMWNIATDLAINSNLPGLPKGALVPGREGTPFEEYPTGMSSEWYFDHLKKNQEDEPEDGQGGDGVGDHGEWGGDEAAGSAAAEIAKQRLKSVVKKAANEASRNRSNGWGSVSQSMRQDILSRLKSHVDWRAVLRYFVKTSQRANKMSTMKRINRRYPYVHPGRKATRQAKIAVSIDQSGSVDDSMMAAFFSELNKLSSIASFTVIPFDHQVFDEHVYEWRKGEKRKTERVLCGGTNFDAPTDYVNERGFDGHIVLTDLYAPKPKASRCQRMWMTTEYHAERPYFTTNERVIAITESE